MSKCLLIQKPESCSWYSNCFLLLNRLRFCLRLLYIDLIGHKDVCCLLASNIIVCIFVTVLSQKRYIDFNETFVVVEELSMCCACVCSIKKINIKMDANNCTACVISMVDVCCSGE